MKKDKKTSKSESLTKPRTSMNEFSWRDELATISINDEDWWCIVTMMVETTTDHSRCVSLFNAAAEDGRRKAIYSLSCQKTLSSVRALSKQSLDKCPTIQGVCHYASNILNEDNEVLPSWLMAQIIKYLIYRAREENIGIVKRLADLEREINEEYWIMQTISDWGQPGSKTFNMNKFNNKANTKLRKRDEDWRDIVYVDDAPISGPNMYVILTGFHDPDLPQHLINNGVPLHCMMQIKRPNERLDRLIQYEAMKDNPAESRKLQFLEDYAVSKIQLYNFWTKVEEYLVHPETHPEFCDVGFITFCPPQYPETTNDDEYTIQKKDMYCRVSYIVYDFYDLYRQHGNYLKSMKVEKGIISEVSEELNMEVYEQVLDSFPLECISVPLILFAILTQVEANEKRISVEMVNSINEMGDAKVGQKDKDLAEKTEIVTEALETDVVLPTTDIAQPSIDSEIILVNEKIKSLNVKFGIDDDSIDESEQEITEIELTLHGNTLVEDIRLHDNSITADIPNANNLIENVLPVFWSPSIAKLYEQNQLCEKKLNDYTRHLDNIRCYFDVKINDEEIRHYLHVLVFDRMIYGLTKTKHATLKATAMEIGDSMRMQDSVSLMKRCKSLPSLTSRSRPDVNILSDGNIDYGKMIPEIIECSQLFDLIDPRELLIPGYLNEHVFNVRPADRPRLEDFNDVELLSRPVFLQLLHECLLSFDHTELQYFEPTDCLLLYFGNKWKINGVHEEERMSSIRTPVRLRDFYKYVVPEEKDWLRREEELHKLETAGSMDRLMRKSSEIYEETMVFRDEDFILPGTLKARDLERRREHDRQKATSEIDGTAETAVKDAAKRTKKGMEKVVSEKEMRNGSKLSDTRMSSKKKSTHQSSSHSLKNALEEPSLTEEPSFDFIGYDLGRLRVQITNRRKTFYSADDTLVQVEIDNWLYHCEDIRTTITLHGYSLRLFHRIGSPDTNDVFHLTSKTGIILSFQKLLNPQHEAEIPFQYNWQDMNVQFRASWPTGLLIQPIVGDGPQNPYYIQQSYVPKGCTGTNGNREMCRKFLRNGTILKYLDNDNIIVLRPNGVIVTCTAFEKIPVQPNEIYDNDITISKTQIVESSGDRPNRQSKRLSRIKRRPKSSSSQLNGAGERGPALSRQNSTTTYGSVTSMLDYKVNVSRYTVLNHDGAQYDVADDLVVSEQHPLLVRMASDYEVDEKFTRRADGTNMLLNSNGELIVTFPDGTRITTGYIIEKEPVMCDWTEEDILQYFTSNGIKDEEEPYVDVSFFNLRYDGEATSRRHAEFEEKITELLITDSFVSVLLTCCMEHKNYATVFYDQSAVSCTLSMPDDLRVSISGRGHYEVSMAAAVNLKINEDALSFKGNSCTICGRQSESTYNFLPLEVPSTILHTMDVFGNTFELKNDGTTHFYPTSQMSQSQTRNLNEHSVESDDQRERFEADYEEGEIQEPCCRHERLFFERSSLGYRIFSINRNLTAYEYIHRSMRNQAEMVAAFDDKTSIILYSSSRRSKLQRLITCEPVGDVSRSKKILSFPENRVKPTNLDRRDLLRSTYSIPYDWLFPFGRNGDGVWKNSHDQPLMADAEVLPELLRIRILRGYKEPGGNAVIDMQKALGYYWMSIVRDIPQPHITVGEEREITEEKRTSFHDRLEDKLFDLALGIEKTMYVETYKIGLQRPWKPAKPKPRRRSLKFDEYYLHKAEKDEQLQQYKRWMREKYILPYFENITGTCFLWIIDCMKNALDISIAKLGRCENCGSSLTTSERKL